MEYSGYATDWDEVVFGGDRDGGEFIAFWLKDGFVVAGMNIKVWAVNEQAQALIRSRRPVDLAALRDPDTPLESLVGETARR
jgi:3-phenylpropionate/trans-cinnamate dioxygenase ferredoxin reductase subunit